MKMEGYVDEVSKKTKNKEEKMEKEVLGNQRNLKNLVEEIERFCEDDNGVLFKIVDLLNLLYNYREAKKNLFDNVGTKTKSGV